MIYDLCVILVRNGLCYFVEKRFGRFSDSKLKLINLSRSVIYI